MLPKPARDYLINTLDNTPATVSALLSDLAGEDPTWDVRPVPDRFSLREIAAHLADWDDVWNDRFAQTLREDMPILPRPDLDRRAQERGYAINEPHESIAYFARKRAALTTWLRALPEDYWHRRAHLERIGEFPIAGLVALVIGHDSHHIRQIVEWRNSTEQP